MNRIFIDVREPQEFAVSHIEGAINIPPAELMRGAQALQNIPKDTELILYCLTGSRSFASMHYLKRMGFTNLINGINEGHVKARYQV